VHDPVAMVEAKRVFALDFANEPQALERIRFSDTPMEALRDVDALVIVTEWKAFRSPDFDQMKSLLKAPLIFDGRNLFEPETMADAGFEYHGIGRSVLTRA
jgi:UDPglucose 6-dehydrogenase